MAKILIHGITVLTFVVGICLAAPSPEPAPSPAPAPQIERLFADTPILQPILDILAKLVALITGVIGEILNLSLIGGLLESLLALGNEDPDGRRK